MGERLPPEQAELYRRIDEVLHYLWDPIGVAAFPGARNEYQSYLPHVFSLLIRHAPEAEIADFLVKTSTETMGLSGGRAAKKHAAEMTSILTNYRDVLIERTVA